MKTCYLFLSAFLLGDSIEFPEPLVALRPFSGTLIRYSVYHMIPKQHQHIIICTRKCVQELEIRQLGNFPSVITTAVVITKREVW